MKAIKHSPEYDPKASRDPKPIPLSFWPDLKVHVRGYTREYKRYDFHLGKGPETFFFKMKHLARDVREIEQYAYRIYNGFTESQKSEASKQKKQIETDIIEDNYLLKKKQKSPHK